MYVLYILSVYKDFLVTPSFCVLPQELSSYYIIHWLSFVKLQLEN